MGAATCLEIILAIILPPLGVFLRFECRSNSGVLDMPVADRIGVPPWNSLCYLYPHQVNKPEVAIEEEVSNDLADGC
ncbi:hypothetical protein RHSIM_Rhsim11G0105700 [Rhododendron simsii]|uniref:Secreted protein n=1 Tax=Rhododendron simsii TaxID=118357 RepID=A0A834G6D2_RHOSS|nr:hypothetical protein RHSIM_Rhsim11G0105700 [Rhododendron simsii]